MDYLISTGDLLPRAHGVYTFHADPDTSDHALLSVDVKLKTKRTRHAQKTRASPRHVWRRADFKDEVKVKPTKANSAISSRSSRLSHRQQGTNSQNWTAPTAPSFVL